MDNINNVIVDVVPSYRCGADGYQSSSVNCEPQTPALPPPAG